MSLAKMDLYDYVIVPGIIRIALSATNDPTLVDILSEIELANGRVYADGHYYMFLGYQIYTEDGNTFMDLEVVETN